MTLDWTPGAAAANPLQAKQPVYRLPPPLRSKRPLLSVASTTTAAPLLSKLLSPLVRVDPPRGSREEDDVLSHNGFGEGGIRSYVFW